MERDLRQQGNALFLTLVLLTMLAGLSAAQVSFQQKNLRQSRFYLSRTALHRYAEAGLALGVHQIRYGLSESPGNVGTENWDATLDYGRDGEPGTADEGEGDGAPTPGEPEVYPAAMGPAKLGIQVAVHVFDTGFSDVARLVATSTDGEGTVTLERYLQSVVMEVPKFGAMFVPPELAIDFKGNAFRVDGNDHDLNGNPAGGPGLHGLATAMGDPPGDNSADLVAQIPYENYDQILGQGGEPSVGEVEPFDINALADRFIAAKTQELAPGTYSSLYMDPLSPENLPVTYTSGDLKLSGKGVGSGVLVVDGNLHISGQFTFTGLIVVRGDIVLSGGGSRIHVIGGTVVGESMTAFDDSDTKVSGQADILYSSEAIDLVQLALDDHPEHQSVLYDENRGSAPVGSEGSSNGTTP